MIRLKYDTSRQIEPKVPYGMWCQDTPQMREELKNFIHLFGHEGAVIEESKAHLHWFAGEGPEYKTYASTPLGEFVISSEVIDGTIYCVLEKMPIPETLFEMNGVSYFLYPNWRSNLPIEDVIFACEVAYENNLELFS